MEIKKIHEFFLRSSSLSIDTRKINQNDMFIALKGNNFDGNIFSKLAIDKGASIIIIDNKKYYVDQRTIIVENCLVTLQELAKYHRNFLKTAIIAITGSNGKTTTKELLNIVLSKKYKTYATFGNLNNHIGVPLSLLSLTKETEIGIIEMGANHKGEIGFLCDIAKPDFGYITNFGKAHLEGFGGVEGVIEGKTELYKYLLKFDKTAFVNLDDNIQIIKTKDLQTISFGENIPNAYLNITKITASPFVSIKYEKYEILSNLIGLYNSSNVSAAITIGKYFDVNDIDIKDALQKYIPENNRSQLIVKNSNEIILDAYNANPSSMAASINNFLCIEKPNKMLILGDMFELGSESLIEHEFVIKSLYNQNNLECFFVGNDFFSNRIIKSNFNFFKSYEDFIVLWKQIVILNRFILIKGSRGMALERLLKYI